MGGQSYIATFRVMFGTLERTTSERRVIHGC